MMTDSSSSYLALPAELRRWCYPSAELEWVHLGDDAGPALGAVCLATVDPYETVVGHYLGLSGLGEYRTQEGPGPALVLAVLGANAYIHILGGTPTRITVTLHDGALVLPPRPLSPPKPGEVMAHVVATAARTDGTLRNPHSTTTPLDGDK